MVLSDDRKGPRPLVLRSASQAQEKSLNVPRGKRARNGPAGPRKSPRSATTPRTAGAQSQTRLTICMCPASITHTVTLNYWRLSVARDLFEGMVCYLGNYAQLNSSADGLAGWLPVSISYIWMSVHSSFSCLESENAGTARVDYRRTHQCVFFSHVCKINLGEHKIKTVNLKLLSQCDHQGVH